MIFTRLCLLLVAGFFANQGMAVHLAINGEGQVLIFPLYTVNNGYQSLLSVSNTAAEPKAVKIRFREGSNQRTVLDFNLYLAGFDTWTAAIFSIDDEGPANLLSRDGSCTVPDIIGSSNLAPFLPETPNGDRYVPFRNFDYSGIADDEGPDDQARTRQGMIEIIELGVLSDDIAGSASAAGMTDGMPNDCTQLNAAWVTDVNGAPLNDESYWLINPQTDMQAPTGSLVGHLTLISVLDATQITYSADAIGGFALSTLNSAPGDALPNLTSADYDLDADGFVESFVRDPASGHIIQSEWDNPIDAVSAVFMSMLAESEFSLDLDINAKTEIVIAFPTKRYYTDERLIGGQAQSPFTELYLTSDTASDGSCDVSATRIPDRGSRQVTDDNGIDCLNPFDCIDETPDVRTCHGTNILSLSDGNMQPTLLGDSLLSTDTNAIWESGQFSILLSSPESDQERQLIDRDGRVYSGLPVIGFTLQAIRNPVSFGAGVIGNYAGVTPIRVEARIEEGQ